MPDIPFPIELTKEQRELLADRLRNPLAIIAGAMELALQYPDPEEDLHRKRATLKAARRLSEEFKQLLGM